MASTSAPRGGDGGVGRIQNAATTLYSDNQSIIGEIRKFMSITKNIAVDLEKENQHQMVKELENGTIELLGASDDCTCLSSTLDSLKSNYQLGEDTTDFAKLFDNEISKFKANSSSALQNHPLVRQFREAIWNVHHAGQPMPGEEQEDIVMTSTESNLLNITCPLSGKPVTDIVDPVRSIDCKHIYDKAAVMHYIKSKKTNPQCPVAGCPKILQAGRVILDPLLHIEIDELRTMNKQTSRPTVIEDCTGLDED